MGFGDICISWSGFMGKWDIKMWGQHVYMNFQLFRDGLVSDNPELMIPNGVVVSLHSQSYFTSILSAYG